MSSRAMWSKALATRAANCKSFRAMWFCRADSASIWAPTYAVRQRRGADARALGTKGPSKNNPGRRKKRWRAGEHPLGAAVNGQAPGEAPQPLTLNHPALNPGCNNSRGSRFRDPAFRDAFRDLLSRTYFPGPARGFRRCQIAWPVTALTRARPPSCRGEPSQCGPKSRG